MKNSGLVLWGTYGLIGSGCRIFCILSIQQSVCYLQIKITTCLKNV